ncbi:MAG: hypothetical protein IM568_04805 [Flavobacterium sp.]|nr:hypothetical protein [Flavobacterium sp.]
MKIKMKKNYLIILSFLYLIILWFLYYYLTTTNYDTFIQISSIVISLISLIVVLFLYDKFGIKGFVKQRELEKIKELKNILTKSRYFYLEQNTHQISDKSISLINIDFNNTIVIEKSILDNLYLSLNLIINNPFFPEKLDLDFSYFHFSKHKLYDESMNKVYDESINNFYLINTSNLFPETLEPKNYRILNENFSNFYSTSINTIIDYEEKL